MTRNIDQAPNSSNSDHEQTEDSEILAIDAVEISQESETNDELTHTSHDHHPTESEERLKNINIKGITKRNKLLVAFVGGAAIVGGVIVGKPLLDFGSEKAIEKTLGINGDTEKYVDEEVQKWEDAFTSATYGSTAPEVDLDKNTATFTPAQPPAPVVNPQETYARPQQAAENMSVQEFLALDRESQVEYGKEKLVSMREDSYKFLYGSTAEIENPSLNDSPEVATEKIVGIIAADFYSASVLGRTDQLEGEKILAVIINPRELASYYDQISDTYIGPGKPWINAKGLIDSTTGYVPFDSETNGATYVKIGAVDQQKVSFTAVEDARSDNGSPVFSLIDARLA